MNLSTPLPSNGTPLRGLRSAVLALAAAVMAMGLTVMLGWHAHLTPLIQLHPTFSPMKYNTALCFVLAGGALIACCLNSHRLALLPAGIVALTGLLTTAEYIHGVDFGIDELLMRGYVTTKTSHPGRMSPIAAVEFSLIGLALMTCGACYRRRAGRMVMGLLCALIIGFSFIAILGYFTGLIGTVGWELLSRMALHTAAGFLATGAGILIITWREELLATNSSPRWLPASTALAALTATVILWHALTMRGQEEMRQTIQANATIVEHGIRGRLDAEMHLLVHMARRWEYSGTPTREAWEADAIAQLKGTDGYEGVAWLDRDLRVQWTIPLEADREVIDGQRRALEGVRDGRRAGITPPVELSHGGAGVLAAVPIYRQGRLEGMFVAVIGLQKLLDARLEKELPAGYSISIDGAGRNLYQWPADAPPSGREFAVEIPLAAHGAEWTVRVSPGPRIISSHRSNFTAAVLVLGGLASVLLGLTVRLTQGATARSQQLSASNRDLKREMDERREAEARLETLNGDLREASRRAGMAEVATSVLHNVGNVLNSVNTSCAVIGDKLARSHMVSVGKTAALLQQHAGDLGAFFTRDPQGVKLPDFLGKLAAKLSAENAEMAAELHLLCRNIDHIKEIVAMQQSYARVSSLTETVSIRDLVDDSVRMNGDALQRHQVELVLQDEGTPSITIEKHKVVQILVNLIRNAKHACDDSGRPDKRITIRMSAMDDVIRVAVSDNGIGIPPENLTRIFRHGFTTRPDGHGFGLHSGALAASELGGSLTVHSDGPGTGATFTLEVPVTRPAS